MENSIQFKFEDGTKRLIPVDAGIHGIRGKEGKRPIDFVLPEGYVPTGEYLNDVLNCISGGPSGMPGRRKVTDMMRRLHGEG